MDLNEMRFVTYAVGCVADSLKISETDAFNLLHRSKVLADYVVPCYDVLHTFSSEYLADDLISLLKERGYL
ncbi:MAG: DUF3791 domain-containing protein [Bacteroidales bacterium]|nr:DUF3791 domain-containing protein [Bacteroidales bacterium]